MKRIILLALIVASGLNASQKSKEQIESAHKNKEIAELQEIRVMMKNAYQKGEYAKQRKAIEVHLIPDLANLCVDTYEELEQSPHQ